MTIENLIRVVPPPPAPFEPFNGPWAPIEAKVGTALPQDYKDFVRLYGCGYFMQFLGINVPRSRNPNTRFESQVKLTCDTFLYDQDLGYSLWPAPGGLLPFGGTDDGDCLFWLPRGAPAEWSVVVWDRGFWTFETFDCDLTDFLAGLATGEIKPREFPDDLLPCDCLFEAPSSHPPGLRLHPAAGASFSLSWRMGHGSGLSGVSTSRLREED